MHPLLFHLVLRLAQREVRVADEGPVERLEGAVSEHMADEVHESVRYRHSLPLGVTAPLSQARKSPLNQCRVRGYRVSFCSFS